MLEKIVALFRPSTDRAAVADELAAARAALATAEAEHASADGAHRAAAEAHDAAAEAYDVEPTDKAGNAVIRARAARDLADLRRDRAAKRLDAARAKVDGLAAVARRAELEAELAAADEAAQKAAELLEHKRAALAHAHPRRALEQVLAFAAQKEGAAASEVERAAAVAADSTRRIAELEAELVKVAPDLADAMAARAEDARAERLAELVTGARVASFRDDVAADVALVVLLEHVVADRKARIEKRAEAQRQAAKAADARGVAADRPLPTEPHDTNIAARTARIGLASSAVEAHLAAHRAAAGLVSWAEVDGHRAAGFGIGPWSHTRDVEAARVLFDDVRERSKAAGPSQAA